MARRRTSERKYDGQLVESKAVIDRVEQAVEEVNMSIKEKQTVKYTRRGLVTYDGVQYYFSANRFTMPVVYGAKSLEVAFELAKALDNKMIQSNSKQKYFKEDIQSKYAQPNVYTDELDKGIFMIKTADGRYMGYLPGAAGLRAVTYRKGGKPYSCAVKSLITSLDKPGNQPFRQMESQGQKIREEMIPELMRIVAILDKRTSKKPDPEGPGPNKSKDKPKEETKDKPQTNTQQEQQQQTKEEQPQQETTRRRRRRTVGENIDTNPKNETVETNEEVHNKETEEETKIETKEVPQPTNEDMHNKDTEEKPVRRTRNRRKPNTNDEQQHEDNGPSNTSSTNDTDNNNEGDKGANSGGAKETVVKRGSRRNKRVVGNGCHSVEGGTLC